MTPQQKKKRLLSAFRSAWEAYKSTPVSYDFSPASPKAVTNTLTITSHNRRILGDCPVASEKTRCCNLKTLDAVMRCGFDCSYCSIQSFYTGGEILFQQNLNEMLQNLNLDPRKIYHIGTGQSSDSLMWGNYQNMLGHLAAFARANPRVILELKTKSDNVEWLLHNNPPKNMVFTWSLNPQAVISHEEHRTASLKDRLWAAQQMHDAGYLVGFHFHPMIYFEGWEREYGDILASIQKNFDPRRVLMVSLGTLTFIKPVIKQIRERDFSSRILQMPLREIAGRYSYPRDIKRTLFAFAYESFSPAWKQEVFFYLCMEDKTLWKDVFGYEYESNKDLEEAMNSAYMDKIEKLRAL
jgi:spore photoproduct lyase